MLEFALFLIFVVFLGVFIILISRVWASYAYKSHMRSYQRFNRLQQEFIDLQDQFIDESWFWPIKVRPVLYLEIDRWAQILFANAQKEIANAEDIGSEIIPIPSPNSEPERKFRLSIYVNIISQHYKTLLLISEYEKHIHNAQSILGELRAEHSKVEKLQIKVRAKVQKTSEEIERIENILKSIYPNVYQELEWAYLGARNCIFEAENQIENARESSYDGLEYAIADTLHSTTEYFIEYINVSSSASKYFVRYELDQVCQLLVISRRLLTIVLRNHAVQNWRMLVYVRSKFRALRELLKAANDSFQKFETDRKLFEQNQIQLKDVKYDELVKQAVEVEKKCEIYWGNYSEGREYWNSFLGGVLPPFRRLEICRKEYQPIVESVLLDSKLIKQSEIQEINNDLKAFQDELSSIKGQIESLEREYERNFSAEQKVNKMLSEGGEVHRALSDLQDVVQDSSPDIQNSFAEYKRSYEKYKQRAVYRKRADFPNLIVEVETLVKNCKSTLIEHHRLMDSLQARYNQLWWDLKGVFEELQIMRNKKPAIEWEWDTLFESYATIVNKYSTISANYGVLSQFIRDADRVIENAKKDKHIIDARWNEFEKQYNQTGQNLKKVIRKLSQLSGERNSEWYAIRHFIKEGISNFQQYYQDMALEWENAYNKETIQEVLTVCNKIDLNTESLQKEIENFNFNAKSHQKRLDGKYRAIHDMLQKHQDKIPRDVSEEVSGFCNDAKMSEMIEEAESYLQWASDYISQTVTSKPGVRVDVHGDYAEGDIHKTTSTKIDVGGIHGTSGGQINIAGKDISSGIDPSSHGD